jgi:hypothetical protein
VTAQTPSAEVKAENQRRADELRAKLLAQRQNTPVRLNTPMKSVEVVSKASPQTSLPQQQTPLPPKTSLQPANMSSVEPSKSSALVEASPPINDIEALLSKGKANAMKTIANVKAATIAPAATNGNTNTQTENVKHETAKAVTDLITRPTEPVRGQANLSDAYYADLPAWLEVTGYHNVDFRNKRLASYKERKALEEEAASIAQRLEQLRQMEEEEARNPTPLPKAPAMAPPALPLTMPTESSHSNGTKRAHSPEPFSSANKRREESAGFRIRGANDSPDLRPTGNGFRRPRSPSPPRRSSISDSRRRSSDDFSRSRDPSLERRQNYYRAVDPRDADRRTSDYRDEYPAMHDRQGPREASRGGYASNGGPRGGGRSTSQQQYRGSASLDLRKGGQSSFSRPV